MTNVFLIAAVGRNGALGLDGTLPWNDRDDLQHFRFMTWGHIVLVGWRTAQTLPVLEGRITVVDSPDRTPEAHIAELVANYGDKHIYVAGGAKTYARYRHLVRRSFITHIDYDGPGDAFMPALW